MIQDEFTWFLWSKMSSRDPYDPRWVHVILTIQDEFTWIHVTKLTLPINKIIEIFYEEIRQKTSNSQSSTTFSQYKQCVRRISVIHQRRILIFIVFQLLVKRWVSLNCWIELIRRFFLNEFELVILFDTFCHELCIVILLISNDLNEFKWSTMISSDSEWVQVIYVIYFLVLTDPNQVFPPWVFLNSST